MFKKVLLATLLLMFFYSQTGFCQDRQKEYYKKQKEEIQQKLEKQKSEINDAEKKRAEYKKLYEEINKDYQENTTTLSKRKEILEYQAKRLDAFQKWNAFAGAINVINSSLQKVNPGTAGSAAANFVADRVFEIGGNPDLKANMSKLKNSLNGTSPAQKKLAKALNATPKQIADKMRQEGILKTEEEYQRAVRGEHSGIVTAGNRYVQEAIKEAINEIDELQQTMPEAFETAEKELKKAYEQKGQQIEALNQDIENLQSDLEKVEFFEESQKKDEQKASEPDKEADQKWNDFIKDYLALSDEDKARQRALMTEEQLRELDRRLGLITGQKQTANIARKLGADPDEVIAFLNCLCTDCGGSLGGYYRAGSGPCVCKGPLNVWETPIPSGNEQVLRCIKSVKGKNTLIDQKDLDNWKKAISEANAKSAEEEIKEIEEHIKNQEYMEAADIFKAIEPLIRDHWVTKVYDGQSQGINLSHNLSHTIVNGLSKQAREHAKDLGMENPLEEASKKMTKACTLNINIHWCEKEAAKYEKWKKDWHEFVPKTISEVKKLIEQGKIITAGTTLGSIHTKINQQELPPRHDDPVLVSVREELNEKRRQYNEAMNNCWKKLNELLREPNNDPRSVVKLTDSLLKNWEHNYNTETSLKAYNSKALQSVRIAKENEKAGDQYRSEGRLPNAIDRYQVSLKIQKDQQVQRKLDELLGQLEAQKKQKKKSGCSSDADCPAGYVCDKGKCVSPFDGGYDGFTDTMTSRDDDRSQDRADQVAADQTTAGSKTGFTAGDLDRDLASVQDSVAGKCRKDSQCPPGYVCQGGQCVEKATECIQDSHCPPGHQCRHGQCVKISECSSDADCADGQICKNGKCVTAPSAQQSSPSQPATLTLSPANKAVVLNETVKLKATYTDTDGSTKDVTSEAEWSPSATFSKNQIGVYPVTATYNGLSAESRITVVQEKGMDDITVNQKAITVTYWDSGRLEDGDMIDILINGKVAFSGIKLTFEKQSQTINMGSDIIVIGFKALNEGSSPPNTASVTFSAVVDGKETQKYSLKKNQSANMNITYRP
jgi:Cys-rich repeat protein